VTKNFESPILQRPNHPFLVANCNGANLGVKCFFSCVNPHERGQCIRINTEMTPDAKWPHHIDFDNHGGKG